MEKSHPDLLELIMTENEKLKVSIRAIIKELAGIRETLDNLSEQIEHIKSQAPSAGHFEESKNTKTAGNAPEQYQDKLLSLKELSEIYPFSYESLEKLAKRGKFPRIRLDREFKAWLNEFDAWYRTYGPYYTERSAPKARSRKKSR